MHGLLFATLVIGSPPKVDALVAAVKNNDPVELDRVARRLGAGRLGLALASDKAEVRQAALEAAPRVDEAWTLLASVTRLCASKDELIARSAVRAARRIAAQLTSGGTDLTELPQDVLRESVRELVVAARTPEVPAPRRAEILGVLNTLAPLAPPPRTDLAPLLDDAAVEVRRAAIDLLGPDRGATDLLARVLERDSQPQVAAGAGAAVCDHLPRVNVAAWNRVAQLVMDARVDPADVVDLLKCLASGGTDERALVAQAAKNHPAAIIRTVAAELAERIAKPKQLVPAVAPARPPVLKK